MVRRAFLISATQKRFEFWTTEISWFSWWNYKLNTKNCHMFHHFSPMFIIFLASISIFSLFSIVFPPAPRSRRFSCLVYARSEVPVRSAVPDEERPKQRPPHPDDAKRRGTGRYNGWAGLEAYLIVGKTMPCLPPMTGNGRHTTYLWWFWGWFTPKIIQNWWSLENQWFGAPIF